MKKLYSIGMVIVGALLLNACSGGGSPAPAPLNVVAVAGDSSVTVTWDMVPGVTYWLYTAAGSSVTPENCVFLPQCTTTLNASSPAVVAGTIGVGGLTNGTTYSFTINGRTGGGPGGPGSLSVSAVPRLAGATWVAGTATAANNLRGVTPYVPPGKPTASGFLAVDEAGIIYSTPDGATWAPAYTANTTRLNAVIHSGGIYLAVGAGGKILRSTDAITWTTSTSGTTEDLYAITSNGATRFVATGGHGTILYSDDGITWTLAANATPNTLYAVAYGNYGSGTFVAVGATGTLLTSVNGGVAWQVGTSNTTSDLHGVTFSTPSSAGGLNYGSNAANTANPTSTIGAMGTFVAVGAGGTLVTSSDNAATWAARPAIASPNLNAVTYWHQFVAVGDAGGIFTSIDGINWTAQTSVASTPLYAVTSNPAIYGYLTVGTAGENLLSR
ncbi:MAG: hypothetical protein V4443_05715 [Pseudomonadota bacterium]